MYDEIHPVPVGMDVAILKQLIDHLELKQCLREWVDAGTSVMISIHHSSNQIEGIMKRVKKDSVFTHWWENLFSNPFPSGKAWHTLIHPIIIILFIHIVMGIIWIITIWWSKYQLAHLARHIRANA